MNEIVKVFKHLARDILIYILPGLTLLSYGSFVCIDLYNLSSWEKLLTSRNFILLIIAAYIIGHIILGFMELFAMLEIDSFIKKIIFRKDYSELIESTKDEKEVELELWAFSNRDAYNFFVERHTQLILLRWNLSGSFFIISISSFIIRFFKISNKHFGRTLFSISAQII